MKTKKWNSEIILGIVMCVIPIATISFWLTIGHGDSYYPVFWIYFGAVCFLVYCGAWLVGSRVAKKNQPTYQIGKQDFINGDAFSVFSFAKRVNKDNNSSYYLVLGRGEKKFLFFWSGDPEIFPKEILEYGDKIFYFDGKFQMIK